MSLKSMIVKNAPTILACMAGAGTVVTVLLTREGTIKSEEELEEKRREMKGYDYDAFIKAYRMKKRGKTVDDIAEELGNDSEYIDDILDEDVDTLEKVKIYAKAYAPAAVMMTATLICIFGSNKINKRRIAGLAGAYILYEQKEKDILAKVEELVGKGKAQEIRDEILGDKMHSNPPTEQNTQPVSEVLKNQGIQLSLWYDEYSGQYFYSNPDLIRKAENQAQGIVNDAGECTVNDVYALLGMKEVDGGYISGWKKHSNGTVDKVRLEIGSSNDDIGNPIGTLSMNSRPKEGEWFSTC